MTVTNPHAISRMAKRADPTGQHAQTPDELLQDEILRFENLERYIAQSAACRNGHVAACPARPPAHRVLAPPSIDRPPVQRRALFTPEARPCS